MPIDDTRTGRPHPAARWSFARSALAALAVTAVGCSLGLSPMEFKGECASDDDCPSGQICHGQLFENTCSADGYCATQADCPSDRQCRVRTEDYSTSATRTSCEDRLCDADSDCAPGAICMSGGLLSTTATCSAVPLCDSDAQCEQGRVCRVRTGWGASGASRTTCEMPRCVHDVDCAPRQICDPFAGGACSEAPICTTDGDCQPGQHCTDWRTAPDPATDRRICQ